jgi:hypothetical protein
MDTEISKDKWAETELGRQFVWGEILRLDIYSKKGEFSLEPTHEEKFMHIQKAIACQR